MTTAEIISTCSLTVFQASLTVAIWNYTYNLRYTRVSLTERLHELWWSKDMMETREEVYALCKQAAADPSGTYALAAYYRAPLVTSEPPGRAAFAKLVGFFCNIEVCLDSKVLDERIACDRSRRRTTPTTATHRRRPRGDPGTRPWRRRPPDLVENDDAA